MQFYSANCLPGSAPSLEDAPVTWKHSFSVCYYLSLGIFKVPLKPTRQVRPLFCDTERVTQTGGFHFQTEFNTGSTELSWQHKHPASDEGAKLVSWVQSLCKFTGGGSWLWFGGKQRVKGTVSILWVEVFQLFQKHFLKTPGTQFQVSLYKCFGLWGGILGIHQTAEQEEPALLAAVAVLSCPHGKHPSVLPGHSLPPPFIQSPAFRRIPHIG